jgi:glycerate dehydrogenase
MRDRGIPGRMKIVVLDGYTVNPGDNPWDDLAPFGELTVYDRTSPDEIVARGEDAEIILTNKTPLRAEIIGRLKKLRFIAVLATGYDTVDSAEAGRRGIPVANVPEYGTDSVAQHTMALLLALCNRVAEHDTAVKRGEWSKAPDFSFCTAPLRELAGKKIGIIGFGRIGQRVGEIARTFGMEILAFNPHHRNRPTPFPVKWMELREVFADADVVTLHCPLTEDNQGFVDESLLLAMKRDALLINTARGKLIHEADLARALETGRIAGAGLDVVSREPIAFDNPLLFARNCLITPHIAWASLDARRRLMAVVVRNVESFLQGTPMNIVNLRDLAQSGKSYQELDSRRQIRDMV